MATPAVPPRPSRSQNIDVPSIPPRPRRSMDRSISPNRDTYARSPLNELLGAKHGHGPSLLSKSLSREAPPRPPSVSLPTIGQEGSEYAQIEQDEEAHEAEQSKAAVSKDLPLHAPKASLPVSAAKARIQTVTRTDSDSAAAHGIGKPRSDAGDHLSLTQTISHSASSYHGSRPSSVFRMETGEDAEQGIPVIGMQIPLYPNAGDVQAPTPSSSVPPPSTGIGFFNKGDQPKNHFRTKSGREVFNGPPGSYGLHGHGVSHDPLEKAWYDKHPDAKAQEDKGEYGPKIPLDRQEYHLSSAELNSLIKLRAAESKGMYITHLCHPLIKSRQLASWNSRRANWLHCQ
jgi:hypothetical protein